METSVKQRLMRYAKEKGISVRKFEQEAGLSNGYLNALKNYPSPEKQRQILYAFPDLSQSWLLTGEGDMLVDDTNVEEEQEQEMKPRLPTTVAAGTLVGFADSVHLYDCELRPVIKVLPPYDYTMIVNGNSMEPKYESGDEIAIRKVHDFIEWGKTHVLDTRDGAVLKRLYDAGDAFRCVSYNPDYPDFNVLKEDVFGVYKVVGQIRI